MPKIPKAADFNPEAPNLLDPTVMFARKREQQRNSMYQGRQSTILASGQLPKAPAAPMMQVTSPTITPSIKPKAY